MMILERITVSNEQAADVDDDVSRRDGVPKPLARDVSVMNVGAVDDLATSREGEVDSVETLTVDIDLPEPELKFTESLGAGPPEIDHLDELPSDILPTRTGEAIEPQGASIEHQPEAVATMLDDQGDDDLENTKAVVPPPEQLLRVEKLIMEIREDGHLAASIDPLGLRPRRDDHLLPDAYDIEKSTLDLDASWLAGSEDATYGWLTGPTVANSLSMLRGLYCGNVGYEFEHVHNVEERLWLQDQVETESSVSVMSDEQRINVLKLLSKAEGFEQYLHNTFPGKRWYSLEGLDSLMVLLDQIVMQSTFVVQQIIIGMAHRGRLNVLAHILDQPYEDVLSGFLEGRFAHLSVLESSGLMTDVKYHLGSRTGFDVNRDGTTDMVLRLLPNPSHLEMVTPAVLGAVRAVQDSAANVEPYKSAMALLIHGDAAFAGQGIVSESLNLMNLDGYSVHGAVHVIANNQIGFTTDAIDAFSGSYASDVARGYEIPVVHVNADDVVACATAAKMAVSYRTRFKRDFVIDLVGYRRYGHNENDDPRITHPTLYRSVDAQPTIREKWAQELIDDGLLTSDDATELVASTARSMDTVRAKIEASGTVQHHEVPSDLGLMEEPEGGAEYADTAVDENIMREVNARITSLPDGFATHSTVSRIYDRRRNAFDKGAPPIDWSHAELLAFGTVLNEGINIRLTGQDCVRGTFSQRHAGVVEANTGETHFPLGSIESAKFWVYNSPLSEAGPVGFEHGYSVQSESTLVLWEAQFGDFVNNAQAVIDEIVVSANEKWGQSSNLVLLLPHGYEGQGPNHSHAHLGRFLELAASGNLRVAFPTTAAQYFHLLRTQVAMLQDGGSKCPLVVMSPKSLLRHPMASSPTDQFTTGRFRPVRRFMLGASDARDVSRVVACTGKVFVDVVSHPMVNEVESVGIIVLEELYPFPGWHVKEAMSAFLNAEDIVWLQEEPKNRGAWEYVRTRLSNVVRRRVNYMGPPRSSSPASGSNWLHRMQQDRLVRDALGLSS